MWLMTKFGFFSVVEKPKDKAAGLVTIRSRVRDDLESLRAYLPQLTAVEANAGTDYAFRAQAAKPDFANALSKIALDIDYSNFKDEVAKTQGRGRAKCYSDVWNSLYQLQGNTHAGR